MGVSVIVESKFEKTEELKRLLAKFNENWQKLIKKPYYKLFISLFTIPLIVPVAYGLWIGAVTTKTYKKVKGWFRKS